MALVTTAEKPTLWSRWCMVSTKQRRKKENNFK